MGYISEQFFRDLILHNSTNPATPATSLDPAPVSCTLHSRTSFRYTLCLSSQHRRFHTQDYLLFSCLFLTVMQAANIQPEPRKYFNSRHKHRQPLPPTGRQNWQQPEWPTSPCSPAPDQACQLFRVLPSLLKGSLSVTSYYNFIQTQLSLFSRHSIFTYD